MTPKFSRPTKFTARRWDADTMTILTNDPQHGGITVAHVYEDAADLTYTRLIESAPELLAACEYVVKWHREHDSGEGELFGLDFVTTCIAAIQKATGE